MRQLVLPKWANAICPGKLEMFADGFYTDWLGRLQTYVESLGEDSPTPVLDAESPTVFWLEVAKICARLEVQMAVSGTDHAPEQGGALTLLISDDSKTTGKWAQKNAETTSDLTDRGKAVDSDLNCAGKEARVYFKAIMGINL